MTEQLTDTPTLSGGAPLSDDAVRRFVEEWYYALDRHDPVGEVEQYLADQGLEMTFPEGKLTGLAAFRDWYHTVAHRFFDEAHAVGNVNAHWLEDGTARVEVVVNWQARVWDPPAPRSAWLGFDAYQTWIIAVRDGVPRIVRYVVDRLDPLPGSASL